MREIDALVGRATLSKMCLSLLSKGSIQRQKNLFQSSKLLPFQNTDPLKINKPEITKVVSLVQNIGKQTVVICVCNYRLNITHSPIPFVTKT